MKTKSVLLLRGVLATAAMFVLGACGTELNEVTGPAAGEAALAGGKGVSNPNTEVSALVEVTLDEQVIYRSDDSPPNSNQANRRCRQGVANPASGAGGDPTPTDGALFNTSNNTQIGTAPHAQCTTVIPGEELAVEFSEIANYVLATSGNIQLNFSVDPVELTPRGIQYKVDKKVNGGGFTIGFGVLTALDEDGRTWTIDLAQFTNAGSPFVPARELPVEACNDDLGCHFGILSW